MRTHATRAAENVALIATHFKAIKPLVNLLRAREHAVQEGAARALLNVIAGSDANTQQVIDDETNNGVACVVGLLRSEDLKVRRLGTMMLSMINHMEKGNERIVSEGGAKLLVRELIENGRPLPELKAICGLCHHHPIASHAVADAVQQHHTFTSHTSEHTPCLLRLLDLVRLTHTNGAPVNEWAVHVLYNMAENSPDLAVRLSGCGAEDVLRDLRTGGSEKARMYAEHTLGLLGSASAKAGTRPGSIPAPETPGKSGALSKITAQMDALVAERDSAVAELAEFKLLAGNPMVLREMLIELEGYRAGGGSPLASTGAPATPLTSTSSGVPMLQLPGSAPGSGIGGLIPPPTVTPRDALTQTMGILDRLAKLVNDLRQVADSGHPVEVVDNHVQSALQELNDGVAIISRLERDVALHGGPEAADFVAQLQAAKEGVVGLADEVAQLASVTEDTVDEENAEDNQAILELAEMLQSLMAAAKINQGA